jgi:hypothetical protein
MTAHELLLAARQAGVVLEVRGDQLRVVAPPGVVTPLLRDELTRCKADLLTLLAPVTAFVHLRGGLTVPLLAVQLALDLEHRGFTMALDEGQRFTIEATADLTDEDRASIDRWRLHLAAILAYDADAAEGVQ